ncbi:MAG: hypothetical protein Q4C70_10565 [Planctomycetia bacterium]|nr:hypothetical protein [Planctomycetia bacterium]
MKVGSVFMRYALAVLLLFIARITWAETIVGTVERVKDGDTLVLRVGEESLTIRFSAIDTPEME